MTNHYFDDGLSKENLRIYALAEQYHRKARITAQYITRINKYILFKKTEKTVF